MKDSVQKVELSWRKKTSYDLFSANRDVLINKEELLRKEDLQSNTVLHLAAWNNDVKTAELCLDNGANVNAPKHNLATALHLAATKGNLGVAHLLITRGAIVHLKDGDSKTPLHRYKCKLKKLSLNW